MIEIQINDKNVISTELLAIEADELTLPQLEKMKELLIDRMTLASQGTLFNFAAGNKNHKTPWFHVPGVGHVKVIMMTVTGRFIDENDQVFIHDGSYILNYTVLYQAFIEAYEQAIENVVAEGYKK